MLGKDGKKKTKLYKITVFSGQFSGQNVKSRVKERVNMVREIKFRIFDKEEKEMNYDEGHFFISAIGEVFDVNDGLDLTSKTILMQYTGLKDKNGEEIYKGDIVKSKHGQIGEVIWENLMWLVSWIEPEYDSYLYEVISCDIIGNIYENPELLKG
jgi:hypothetical protein